MRMHNRDNAFEANMASVLISAMLLYCSIKVAALTFVSQNDTVQSGSGGECAYASVFIKAMLSIDQ